MDAFASVRMILASGTFPLRLLAWGCVVEAGLSRNRLNESIAYLSAMEQETLTGGFRHQVEITDIQAQNLLRFPILLCCI